MPDTLIITITGCGDQKSRISADRPTGRARRPLLQIVYEGPDAPAYAALAELAGGEGRIN